MNKYLFLQERLLEAGVKQNISVPSTTIWPTTILGDTLRIVFQNLLLESNDNILECSERVWRLLLQVFCFCLSSFLLLFFCFFIFISSFLYSYMIFNVNGSIVSVINQCFKKPTKACDWAQGAIFVTCFKEARLH